MQTEFDYQQAASHLRRLLHWLETQLTARSIYAVGALIAVISLVKTGVTGTEAIVWSTSSFPDPVDMYPQLSYGTRSIAYLLGLETNVGYSVMGIAFFVATDFLICLLASRVLPRQEAVWVIVLLLSGPMLWVLSGRLVHTDAFVLMGAVVVAFGGRRLWLALLGAVLASLGSPEQALIAFGCLSLLGVVPRYRSQLPGAVLAAGFSALAFASLTMWASSLGVATRSSVFLDLIKRSIGIFATQFPLTLYSGFGLSLAVVVFALLNERFRWALVVFLASVFLPLTFAALTTDQSRILVITSSAVVTALVIHNSKPIVGILRQRLKYPVALTFLLASTQPAIEVTGWTIRVPWINYYSYFQAYIVSSIQL